MKRERATRFGLLAKLWNEKINEQKNNKQKREEFNDSKNLEQMTIQVDEGKQLDGNGVDQKLNSMINNFTGPKKSENTLIELLKQQYKYEDFKQNLETELEKYLINEQEKKDFRQSLPLFYVHFIDQAAKEQNQIKDFNQIINFDDIKKNVFNKFVKNIRDELKQINDINNDINNLPEENLFEEEEKEIKLLRDKLEYPKNKNENKKCELKRANRVDKTHNKGNFFYNQSWSERSTESKVGFVFSIFPGLGLPLLFNLIYNKCSCNCCATVDLNNGRQKQQSIS